MNQALDRDREHLASVAAAFHPPEAIESIRPLGSGNVNDTYLVRAGGELFVLQRLNTAVFRQPQRVIRNLQVLNRHVQGKLQGNPPELRGRRWELPQLVSTRHGGQPWTECRQGGFWRTITFVGDAHTVDVIEGTAQARELGYGLGMFHHLISDLPHHQLFDTLEGFHITPHYLDQYTKTLEDPQVPACAHSDRCRAFIREREGFVSVLEDAKQRGELRLRPIHGDPKINNVMLDRRNGQAVALIDLDTVKPGLVHYDIGDCLRSCCNPLGEETTDFDAVHFDTALAEAILTGYLSVARGFLTATDIDFIVDAVRLISFELGLRFFSDYLAGSVYFKANHPQHNLHRALAQFRLTESIEAQEGELRKIVERLSCQAGLSS